MLHGAAAMLCVIFGWNELLNRNSFVSIEWQPLSVAAERTSRGRF
jgi:hypothetical protein